MSTATRLHRGPADHGRTLALQDCEDAGFAGEGLYELSRGTLNVVPTPDEYPHVMVHALLRALIAYDLTHPGRIHRVGGGSGIRIYLPAMRSDRHPDVAVSLRGTSQDANGRRPPSLVVEVVSEGEEARRRDYVLRREEYLAHGLLEYWIVDPFERKVTVLLRQNGRWIERVFAAEPAAEGLVRPGLRVPLAELWTAGTRRDTEPPVG